MDVDRFDLPPSEVPLRTEQNERSEEVEGEIDLGRETAENPSAERVVEVKGDVGLFDQGRKTADMFSAEL